MNKDLCNRIINTIDKRHKSAIESMKKYADKGMWSWAIPIESPPIDEFAVIHQMDKEVAKHYREIIRLTNKYTPTNGCDNCWGDLHQGCTEKCKVEGKLAHEFVVELYSLVRGVLNAL